MEAFNRLSHQLRNADIKNNGIALAMLAIALFALFSNILIVSLVPLLWMGYRVGKEIGRREAQDELSHEMLSLPDQRGHS